MGRYVHADIDPLTLSFFRWLGVAILLLPIFIKRYAYMYTIFKQNILILSVLSILGVTFFNTFLYIGLQDTTATNALLINSSIPVLILVLSFFILKIPIAFKQFIGIILSTIGVIFLIIKGEFITLLNFEFNIGDIWIISASLSWAFYSVLLKFKPKDLKGLDFFTLIAYVGLFWLSILYLLSDNDFYQDIVHVKDFYWVFIYISFFASVLSFFFWNKGIEVIGANKTGQFTHLMPLFGAILAYVFLGEHIQNYHIIGAIFIAIGIYLSLFGNKK